ncbi:acetyl-CoA carboxyltransferase subunit alpha [Gammaproteobacteria bacterium]
MLNSLDFEQPITELEAKIAALRVAGEDATVNISEEIERLEAKCKTLTESIFSNLSAWQISQLARHPQRPYTLQYIQNIFTDFEELHGDRAFSDDPAIVGGIGRLDGSPVMILGHQKGHETKEKIRRNFGMPRPEGYRKALRLMEMAERFHLPVLTFIDTPGAYPGVGAEERNQSEAIARNLKRMAELRTPIVCTVIGEGGSGGALAIGVGDRVLMLEYSVYSVISPEGCASILWKSSDNASDAAEALGLTAARLKELGLITQVIPEPLGAAHRQPEAMAVRVKRALLEHLSQIQGVAIEDLLESRYQKLMGFSAYAQREDRTLLLRGIGAPPLANDRLPPPQSG